MRGCRRAADVLIVGQSRPGRVYPIAHATSRRLRKRQIQLERARVRKRIDRLTKAVSGVLVVIGCALTDICVRGCDAFAKLRCQSWRKPDRQTGADEHACRECDGQAIWRMRLCL